ncbi:dipeptidase [Nocardioides sp. AN3]
MTAKNPEKIVPVFDPHNNFLLELDYRSKEERPFERHWLQHLIDGGVKVQVCAVNVCYRPPAEKLGAALRQIAAFHRAVAEAGDQVTCIRTSEDLDRVLAGDSIGLVLALEGVDIMDGDLELLEAVWELGVRWFGLTWNYSNTYAGAFGDGNGRGLSDQGRELVKQLQERGGVIDLAHASPETVSDVLALEHMIPPVVTHSACQAVFDSPRNMTDDQLREMAVAGGVLGVLCMPFSIDPEAPTMERVVDHIDHARSILGIGGVGIGGDFYRQVARSGAAGSDPSDTAKSLKEMGHSAGEEDLVWQWVHKYPSDFAIDGLAGPEEYQDFVAVMRSRSWSGDDLSAVMYDNFMRVLRTSLKIVDQAYAARS